MVRFFFSSFNKMVATPSGEQWKYCFETYEVSDQGRCRRKLKCGRYIDIKGSVSSTGYRYFQVQRGGRRFNKMFHHMVAFQFIGPRPDGLVIDHIDQCKTNNSLSNLRYATYQINSINTRRYRHDLPIDPVERRKAFQAEARRKKKFMS